MLALMSDVTGILSAIEQGDASAAEQLLPLVYDELRKLAAAKLAQEKPGQTLQATALVHDAYIRLVDGNASQHWNNRGHFFGAAAEAMRRILVDSARRRRTLRRGGDANREELSELSFADLDPPDDLLAVHDVLDQLSEVDPVAGDLVKLRYFVGLNMSEVAEALGIS